MITKGNDTKVQNEVIAQTITDESAKRLRLARLFQKQEIKENFKFEDGVVVLVTGGKHTGELGKIQEVIVDESSKPNTAIIEKANGDSFLTLKEYAFVIGKDEPAIDLLEVNQ